MRDRIGKRSRLTLVALTALFLAAPSWAQDDDEDPGLYEETGLYLMGMATYAVPAPTSDLERATDRRLDAIYGPGSRTDVGNSWGLNGRAGYRLHKHVAIETQFEWLTGIELRSKAGNGAVEPKTDISLFALTGNAKGYLLTGRIQPYAVAGAGWARSRTDVAGSGANKRDDGVVYRFGAGVDAYANPDFALTLEASYVIPEGQVDDLSYVSIGAGFTLRFYPLE